MLYVLLLSSREKLTNFLCVTISAILHRNGRYAFLAPYEGLGATYHDHLRLIGKRVVDFLLVLTELFSLGVTAEALRENIGSKSAISLQRGPVDPKFQVERVAPTSHSSSQKTRLNDLSNGVKIWTDLTSVLSQSTRLTDRQTPFSSLVRAGIPCMRGKTAHSYTLVAANLLQTTTRPVLLFSADITDYTAILCIKKLLMFGHINFVGVI